MSCVRSTIGASVIDVMTPFIAATYGSRVPKSVRRAMRIVSMFVVRGGPRRGGTSEPVRDSVSHEQRTTNSRQRPPILADVFETIPPPPRRLLLFARLPERGRVKTRLAADLGDDRALA